MSNTNTMSRALEVNLQNQIYGTFAEIGAGQEVARYFFQAGKASQTIAKTISAYDMIYSDEIYGREISGRYVCESRLNKMLDKEYNLLHKRLDKTRGDQTCFFAYANTVATGDQKKRFSHGWMGIRFQKKPGGDFNDIVMHVQMRDKHRLQQQEALGILGVNLVWAAFFATQDRKPLIDALVDGLKLDQVKIDMIRCNGKDLDHINNHLLNLELVRRRWADAILFGPDESILSLRDHLYQKPIMLERGNFRPVTNTHLTLMNRAEKQFPVQFSSTKEKPLCLFELTMQSLLYSEEDQINDQDFLQRVRALAATGHHVLVSQFFLFYQLKQFLRNFSSEPLAVIAPANHLERIFDKKHYQDLDGGILEGLGKFLDKNTSLFIYPHKEKSSCINTKSFVPDSELLPIYQYFTQQKWLLDLSECSEAEEYIHSDEVYQLIQKGKESDWKKLVPANVAKLIEAERLFRD